MAKKKKTARKSKKAVVRKRVKKASAARRKRTKPRAKAVKKIVKKAPELGLEKIGEVTHYFPRVFAAAVLLLKDGLKVGDKIYLKGHTTNFKEKVRSMQLDHVSIDEGKKAQEIGLLVKSRVRIGDSVYRI